MVNYSVRPPRELSSRDIRIILEYWEIEEWKEMTTEEFNQKFASSEFHLLTDRFSNILCAARINFDFNVKIDDHIYPIAELVGLVAMEKKKGHGGQLMGEIRNHLNTRKIEAIGFCEKQLRPFYEKCNIPMLYGKAKWLREKEGDEWIAPTDDDILNLTLSQAGRERLESLNATRLGYILLDEDIITNGVKN